MPLGTFAPGPYTMTYTPPTGTPGAGVAQNPGLVDGVRILSQSISEIPVFADAYGQSQIDGIYAGGGALVRMTFKEWKAAVWNIIWPFHATSGALGNMGQVGRMMSDLAGQIVLTPVAGTPAASAGPQTGAIITIPLAIVSPLNDRDIIMGCAERNVPIVFRCFPYNNAGTIQWYSFA